MNIFKQGTLAAKIIAITMLSIISIMLLVVYATHEVEIKQSKMNFKNELIVIADIIGNRSQAALVFDDEIAGTRNLNAARFHPYIQTLCLYNKAGDLVSKYLREGRAIECSLHHKNSKIALDSTIDEESVALLREIFVEEEIIGYLKIYADLSNIQTNSLAILKTLITVLLASLAFSSLIVITLIKKTLKPLAILRDTASHVAANPFGPVRAKKYNNDEVGDLVQDFNDMLDRLNEEKQALDISNEALRRTQRLDAVGRLSGGIAHDFNNILGIILGNVEILKMVDNIKDAPHSLDDIDKATQRAIDLTGKLLKFTHGKPSTLTTVDLNVILLEMKRLLERSITPDIDIEYSLIVEEHYVSLDQGDFEDAILNLTINARDAMSNRGKIIIESDIALIDEAYCTLNPEFEPGEYIIVSVSDTGDGMTEETQARIFEPFFSTKSDFKSGTNIGMGMAMVFGFIKRSKAHIKVISKIGIGTTMKLFFPTVEKQPLGRPLESEILEGKPRGNETVLVVDDEKNLLSLARTTLQRQGYIVLTASNGEDALDILSRERVDLLFSDVVMPGGINGYDLVKETVTRYPKVKILLTSGYATTTLTYDNNINVYYENVLNKPYTQQELINRIRDAIDNENF